MDALWIASLVLFGVGLGATLMFVAYRQEAKKYRARASEYRKLWLAERGELDG